MSHKKLGRLYGEEGLAVKRRKGRKRALGTRAPLQVPERPNECWSLDSCPMCWLWAAVPHARCHR